MWKFPRVYSGFASPTLCSPLFMCHHLLIYSMKKAHSVERQPIETRGYPQSHLLRWYPTVNPQRGGWHCTKQPLDTLYIYIYIYIYIDRDRESLVWNYENLHIQFSWFVWSYSPLKFIFGVYTATFSDISKWWIRTPAVRHRTCCSHELINRLGGGDLYPTSL